MSRLTPQRLRRVALVSLGVGIMMLGIFALLAWASSTITEWNNSNSWISGLTLLADFLGCGVLIFAGNSLAWSFIVPKMPTAQPRRNYVSAAVTVVFALVSIVATFFLLLGSFFLPNL